MSDYGIKIMKQGNDISSTNIDDHVFWSKYPPLTFLEKKSQSVTITTAEGCPSNTTTDSVSHSYGFPPLVLATVEEDNEGDRYWMPADNFVFPANACDMDHELRLSFDYDVDSSNVDINYTAFCTPLIMGGSSECISNSQSFTVDMYFYMWELGSTWST